MLEAVARVLHRHGADGWLVGGSVRDRESGRPSPDIDVVVAGDAHAISRDVARELDVPWFTLSEEYRAYRVVGPHEYADIAAMRGPGVLHDLGERDFTVNAMALPIGYDGSLGELIDPFGGLADLRAGRLAAVSDRVFTDDPLRLMRAARFAHVLRLQPAPALMHSIRAQAPLITLAAPERVTAEMFLTLDAARSGDAVRLWRTLGLLPFVLADTGGSEDEALPALLEGLEGLLAHPAAVFPGSAARLGDRLRRPVDGSVTTSTALRLTALFRRVGPGEAVGVGRRLKLSTGVVSLIETAARMARMEHLPQVASSGAVPGREAVSFLWNAAPWEPEIVVLAAAAASGRARVGPHGEVHAAQALMTLWDRRATADTFPLDGNAVMQATGAGAGPRLGRALREARLAWEAGEVSTGEQAMAVARAALAEA
jgi:hypothetical protein